MEMLTITPRTAPSDPAVTVIDLMGELDINTVGVLETEFNQLWKRKRYKIVLNFEKLTYSSTAGIGFLLGKVQRIRKKGGDILIVGLRPEVYRLFDLLELFGLFNTLPTEQDAIAVFAVDAVGAPRK